jgi:diguanylate cyclase (GGDEF)-like protein
MTISVGVAQADSSMATFDSLLKRADDAVYAAKAAGRDRVMVDGPRDGRIKESA